MTSKRKQISKTPISIYFNKEEISKYYSGDKFKEYKSYLIYDSTDRLIIDLSKISHLSILQKNYILLLLGSAIKKHCKSGNFFIKHFGCTKTDVKNFYLGWSLSDYSFDKFKSCKEDKNNAKIFHKFEKEINTVKESYFFIRDLINSPANILGPKEIFKSTKNFLKGFKVSNLISGKELEKKFPLIS